MGLPGDSGRIGIRTRWTIKVDALGSITSNCTVRRSTPDDAEDVDQARYGDEGKNSRHFVSNEQIPLPVRDHIGRTTAETRQQLELKSAAHVASATKPGQRLKVVYVDETVKTLNGIRGDEQVDLFWTKVTTKAGEPARATSKKKSAHSI